MLKQILFILFIVFVSVATATEYQSQTDFLSQTFSGSTPKPKILWISKDLKTKVSTILQHNPGFLRTRYWQKDNKTVWILNETGKSKPITVAIVIENHKINRLKVLAFRESRGWEVKHDFFTNQFKQITLQDDLTLTQPIDGISGATLSVRALKKIARLALLFDSLI